MNSHQISTSDKNISAASQKSDEISPNSNHISLIHPLPTHFARHHPLLPSSIPHPRFPRQDSSLLFLFAKIRDRTSVCGKEKFRYAVAL